MNILQAIGGYWREQISRNWIIGAVLVVWFINAGMNGVMGYDTGDGGMLGILYGGVFVSIAACGAYAANNVSLHNGIKWWLMGGLVIMQLTLGQLAGWQTMGLTLDRGSAARESKASNRSVTKERLARLREERRALGTIAVPVATLRAKMALEKKKRSGRYKNGEGPEYTKLASALGIAEKASDLDDKIAAASADYDKAPTVQNANVLFEVPAVLASRVMTYAQERPVSVSVDDVRFVFLVFVVGMLEFMATLGFWLFGRDDDEAAQMGGAADGAFDPALLPAVPRVAAITNDNDTTAQRLVAQQVPESSSLVGRAGEAGGGVANIINVGTDRAQHPTLPPRIAALRGRQ